MPTPAEAPVPSPPPPLLLSFVEPAGLRAVGDPLGRRSASSVASDGRPVLDTLICPASDGLDGVGLGAVVGAGARLGLPGMLVSADGAGAGADVAG